ncbi:nuclear transport factor 2 family protein [Crocosphaera sp. UHCC 0190]|uniref:nuclear transport factor 2 family protein n=1 Tax=Crocosphaera sp. UHCC 0190 TaxID=3110246 RepID=UPI002B20362A|nr:nuclear transport factor 2 family protein [Crocosphaera sp. UHCC 0190]MEA5512131.1 nuclear transport factor 2 family protein [Crocosphaera sp. UHCC 0190]
MIKSAKEVIESIYQAINNRDIEKAIKWVDNDCIYQDVNFSQAFEGKESVKNLFKESCENVPDDFKFVIDEITTEDPLKVGVLWHVELDNIPIPNGRGVSFYRISETTGKLIFARDIVEPPLKPGKLSFFIIRLVTPLIRRFLKQDSTTEKRQPILSIFFWLLSGTYIYILLCSAPNYILPGEPFWAVQPETIKEVINESINFFFILPLLNIAGIHLMESPIVHPIIEAQFNFAEAWIFMFLPLLLADKRVRKFPKVALWTVAMFLTNVFLSPYMAFRFNQPIPQAIEDHKKGLLDRLFGWIGLIIGIIAIVWIFIGRPEFGDLAQRLQYFITQLNSSRVVIAFSVDLVLFAIFQMILMGAVIPPNSQQRRLRFIPFFGLAFWLII